MLLLFLKCKFDHVSPLLKILHLLLITFGIKSNLFGMPHKVLCDLAPIYHSAFIYPTSLPWPNTSYFVLKHSEFPEQAMLTTPEHLPLLFSLIGTATHPPLPNHHTSPPPHQVPLILLALRAWVQQITSGSLWVRATRLLTHLSQHVSHYRTTVTFWLSINCELKSRAASSIFGSLGSWILQAQIINVYRVNKWAGIWIKIWFQTHAHSMWHHVIIWEWIHSLDKYLMGIYFSRHFFSKVHSMSSGSISCFPLRCCLS